MQDLVEKRNGILAKIDIIINKVESIDDNTTLFEREQIVLILSNLVSTLEHCDKKYLLKPILENIYSNIVSIETYVNQKQYKATQSYLTEIVRNISLLNNANGKHNLQGYHKAVNKNIDLLEAEVEKSLQRLDELESSISEKSNNFASVESQTLQQIERYRTDHEKELSTLNEKYEKFTSELSKKQEDSHQLLLEEQQKLKKESSDELIKLKTIISKIQTEFQSKSTTSLTDFDAEKTKKIEELDKQIDNFISQTHERLEKLEASATEKIGRVAASTHSNIYKKYSNGAKAASIFWYIITLLSLSALVGSSVYWFMVMDYANTDYVLLIARICASIGFAVVSRYSAIQASKNKVVETKLRKIQLQMGTFDAFVASLDKGEQDNLKKDLTRKLIEQEDWIHHDKNEIDTVNEAVKLLEKLGYNVELNKTNR